ncbi:MAG: hypothetical protein E6018_13720 [Clostridium perfringens]|nr:hypothetical protein [Clostridium perfringens]
MNFKKYSLNYKIIVVPILLLVASTLFWLDYKYILRLDMFSLFRKNIFYLSNLISKFNFLLLILITILIFIILKKKWVFRIEKMSCGGLTFVCNKPEKILKQNIKNFLETKRTLFKINEKKDNFYDTINSYYETYKFIRNEISVYDIDSKQESLYKYASEMIKVLNEFLTDYQSDYKRWYEYIRDYKKDDIYDKDIYDIQKDYRNYNEIMNGFLLVNNEFNKYAKNFDINVEKWEGI